MNFAKNLKALRTAKNVKQYQITNELEFSRQAVCQWETRIREPNLQTLCALADYFGVTTDQLLGRTPLPEAIPPKVKLRKVTMIRRRRERYKPF